VFLLKTIFEGGAKMCLNSQSNENATLFLFCFTFFKKNELKVMENNNAGMFFEELLE